MAVLVGSKGRGSNLGALLEATQPADFPAEVSVVVSPVPESQATERAKLAGVRVETVSPKDADYTRRLREVLDSARVEWVCLAGLMTKLPADIVDEYSGRILNVHPSLLPKHGGQGMYGLRVHEAVLAGGEARSGCTVHLVTHQYDEGPIVLQLDCPVEPDDTPERLAARVLELEHRAFPLALRQVIEAHARTA